MATRRTYGSLSLELPEGFIDETTIALARPQPAAKEGAVDGEALYPLNLTIVRDQVGKAPDPQRYLTVKLGQLRGALQGFSLRQAPTAERVGPHPAAAAHFSFVARFALEQLVLVWFAGPTLLTATLSTTAPGVAAGWQVLRQVAATVRAE